MKRLFDFILATVGIVILSPLAILFALLVKLEDGRSIFYTQDRWGKKGRRFQVYKFRTMVDGDRVTRVGRFLRATAMDELPQLFNIWRGDMSFVGPRAFSADELDPAVPGFSERHQIRPGLTGPAQIFAPRYASIHEKFRYDLNYVRHHPFKEDIRFLFLSVWITLRGKWESREKKV